MTNLRFASPDIPWIRNWVHPRGRYALDSHGFLDVVTSGELASPQHRLLSTPELETADCLVMLGEPGSGKSTELRKLHARSDPATSLFLDLRSYSTDMRLSRDLFESPAFTRWRSTPGSSLRLYLDSFDECGLHLDTIATLLLDSLAAYPLDRLQLRLASRSVAWSAFLDAELGNLWGNRYMPMELLPLNRQQVIEAALSRQVDQVAFMDAVLRRHASPFASRPLTLRFLLDTFARDADLPADPFELYSQAVERLIAEPDAGRSSSSSLMTDRERVRIARRIAAATVFANRPVVSLGAAGDDNAIPLSHLTGSDSQGPVTAAALREVLDTPLFNLRAPSHFGWSHQAYADFLAADFLIVNEVEPIQILDIVCPPQDPLAKTRLVPPQLLETAAWIAAKRPDFRTLLLDKDPAALLRPQVSALSVEERRTLLTQLLTAAARGDLAPHESAANQRDYTMLCDPELDAGLSDALAKSTDQPSAALLAVRVALACRRSTLNETLGVVASDPAVPPGLRESAANALAELADAQSIPLLMRLLSDPMDSRDELKGAALEGLWRLKAISPKEVLEHLTPPRESLFFGSYYLFVQQDLASAVERFDVDQGLSWILSNASLDEAQRPFGRFVSSLLRVAWGRMDNSTVLATLCALAVNRLLAYEGVLPERFWEDAGNLSESSRRQFLEALLPRIRALDIPPERIARTPMLVSAADFHWLLEAASTVGADSAAWLRLAMHVYQEGEQHLTIAWRFADRHPALKPDLVWLLGPIPVDSPMGANYRENLSRVARRSEKAHAAAAQVSSQISALLRREGIPSRDAWWRLLALLGNDPLSGEENLTAEFVGDPTALPGWRRLSPDEVAQCVSLAEAHLRTVDPATERWLGTNTIHRPATAGYKALAFLLKTHPQSVGDLPPDIWSKWSPAVRPVPPGGGPDDTDKTLIRLAFDHAPAEASAALEQIAKAEIDRHQSVFVVERLPDGCNLASPALNRLIGYASQSQPSVQLGKSLLRTLLRVGEQEGLGQARALLTHSGSDSEADRTLAAGAGAALLSSSGSSALQAALPALTADRGFAAMVLGNVAMSAMRAVPLPESAPIPDLVELLIVALKVRTPSTGSLSLGFHQVSESEAIDEYVGALARFLVRRAALLAAPDVARIDDAAGEYNWFRRYVAFYGRDATGQTWSGLPLQSVLDLAPPTATRLVQSTQHLMVIVQGALKDFQERLQGRHAAVVDLWNEDKTPKNESYLSLAVARHLDALVASSGIVANREVKIRNGQDTDIYINAVTPHTPEGVGAEVHSLVAEVKCDWNPEVLTALRSQLRDRYMRTTRSAFGIYVVGYYGMTSGPRRSRFASLDEAIQRLAAEAAQSSLEANVNIAAVVLDLRWAGGMG